MRTLFECLETKVPTMQHLAKLFCDPESDQPNAFNDVLHFLSEEVSEKSGNFRSWIEECLDSTSQSTTESCDMDAIEKFGEETEELISAVLLVVQKLSKHHSTENEDLKEREATDDGKYSKFERVPTSSGNHGKPGKSLKKSSIYGKIMEF